MKNRFNIYLIAIILLSVSQAFMHMNFLVGHEDIKIQRYNEQIAYAKGMHTDEPAMQSRLLFPNMLKVIGAVMPQQVLSERYHAGLSLAFAEWISIFFSLTGLFLLSNEIFRSRLKAFFVIVFYSIYLPYVFQLPHRFGEAFIFGFFCFLTYAVIARKQRLFILLLLLCSFQRVDIAFISVFFKIVYEFFEHGKKYKNVFVNSLLFIIPWIVIFGIMNLYDLKTADEYLAGAPKLIRTNLRHMPLLFFCYLPVFVLSSIRLTKFDRKVYYLLFGLIPYLFVTYFLGGFSETRLLHPLIVTLVIGIVSSLKDTEIHDFVDSELTPKT